VKHLRVVGEVVLRRDERDPDRVPAPLRRLQHAEQPELERLGGAAREGRVEQLGLEIVARRVAVPERAGRRGQRDEHGENGEPMSSQ
jgi:hypothetical protein